MDSVVRTEPRASSDEVTTELTLASLTDASSPHFFSASDGCSLHLLMETLMRLSVNGSWILFLPQVIINLSNSFPLTRC